TPFAFMNGFVFGSLSRGNLLRNPYGLESLGALIGCGIVYTGVLAYLPNAVILCLCLIALALVSSTTPLRLLTNLAAMSVLFVANDPSMHWKYPFPFSSVIYGREGEIVSLHQGSDTSYLIDGTLYKSTAEAPLIEQAVHIPLAQITSPRTALVVFDKGQRAQLKKYPGLSVDCIEPEPMIAAPGSMSMAPEAFKSRNRYDVILVAAGLPHTAAANRFYTISFFKRMKSMLREGGVFSFTLPLSENYLSFSEKRLYATLQTTLAEVFDHVLIFPGTGYTFLASAGPMKPVFTPRVSAPYLQNVIIPSVNAGRIASANQKPDYLQINTAQRPFALLLELSRWLEQFRLSAWLIAAIIVSTLLASLLMLPKTMAALSMASSGFVIGVYSVALLLVYQSTYGLLYSRVSLFLMSLTCGVVLGTFVITLKSTDLLIGAYCLVTRGLLCIVPAAPAFLYIGCHAGMGFLLGAQFTSFNKTHGATLFAADLFGGAIGMFLCSTLMVPLFGVFSVAAALCILKMCIWLFDKRYGHREAALRIFKS
ncbi:MAG TPA: hypothetical protein VF335_10010, partial [Chitinivibrionales bacterium]